MALWVSINTGPWTLKHTPEGVWGWLHWIRTTFPLLIAAGCAAFALSRGSAVGRMYPGPVKLWLAYGVIGLLASAGFCHYPSPSGRSSMVRFGRVEVANRLYFVRKHGLSVPRCYLGLMIRLLLTLAGAFSLRWRQNLGRAWGNCIGLFQSIAAQPGKGSSSGPTRPSRPSEARVR